MKKILIALYNFFHIFKKDKGAHFAYDLGVGFLRAGVFMVLIGFGVLVVSLSINSFHMKYLGDPDVTYTVEHFNYADGNMKRYMVHFTGKDHEGRPLTLDEFVTAEEYNELNSALKRPDKPYFMLYRVSFNRGGGDLYISQRKKLYAMMDYANTHEQTMPLSLAGMWVSFGIALLLFLMGRKQMKIGLKYPRSDVPEVLSGAPVISDAPENPCEDTFAETNETKALPLTETITENE